MTADPINLVAATATKGEFALGLDHKILADQLEALAAGIRENKIVLAASASHNTRVGSGEFTTKELTIGYYLRVDTSEADG